MGDYMDMLMCWLQAFSIFCGLGLHNCVMYENVCMLMAKQSVALEVLSYHASASPDETMRLKVSPYTRVQSCIEEGE